WRTETVVNPPFELADALAHVDVYRAKCRISEGRALGAEIQIIILELSAPVIPHRPFNPHPDRPADACFAIIPVEDRGERRKSHALRSLCPRTHGGLNLAIEIVPIGDPSRSALSVD